MEDTRVDVMIVGAGLSGIAAAQALQTHCPHKTFCILESRQAIGGTWDLFRYPGVRSDSDMYTLGYSFRPWRAARAIAAGRTILEYIRDTAAMQGLEPAIRFGRTVRRAAFRTDQGVWRVEVAGDDGTLAHYTCQFLFACTGYYDYEQGYQPQFPGMGSFTGRFVHPQRWPEDLDVSGQRVVVIGSGATAVTLVPELARQAAHVTMLQRSPTYLFAAPAISPLEVLLRRLLPIALASRLLRWWNIGFGIAFFSWCRRSPARASAWLIGQVRRQVGSQVDVQRHFTPRYNPWEQRLCLVPDGDLFAALRAGRVSVVTDQIDRIEPAGIVLRSGDRLDADIIVSATGLNLRVLGGIELEVDGSAVDPARTLSYKGSLFSGIPNLACAIGYTNASWTLKLELTCHYVCRLLNHMDRRRLAVCVPVNDDAQLAHEPWLNLTSGYIQRAADRLPQQGSKRPWRLRQNYVLDYLSLRYGRLDDGVLRFSGANSIVRPGRSA